MCLISINIQGALRTDRQLPICKYYGLPKAILGTRQVINDITAGLRHRKPSCYLNYSLLNLYLPKSKQVR